MNQDHIRLNEIPVSLSLRLTDDELAILDEMAGDDYTREEILAEILPQLIRRTLQGDIEVELEIQRTTFQMDASEVARRMAELDEEKGHS